MNKKMILTSFTLLSLFLMLLLSLSVYGNERTASYLPTTQLQLTVKQAGKRQQAATLPSQANNN